tara:strand:+ start:837 stop:1472 length:636 start_codon:yes stop_codon:yes gene_type:complete
MDDWIALGISVAALVAGFFSYFFGFKKKKKSNKSDIISPKIDFPDHFWEVHTKIQETITELRVKVNCARSHLVQFHNGGHFMDGISMKRMSLTHESLERSVSGEMKNHQDLLMSIYMEILNHVKKDRPKLIMVNEMDECYAKQDLESGNVIAFSLLPIKQNSLIIGYIMVEWCSWNKVDEIEENIVVDWMSRSQSLIEVELTNQKRKNRHK